MKAMIQAVKAYSAWAFGVVEVNLGVGAKGNVMEVVTVANFEVAWSPFVGSGGVVIVVVAVVVGAVVGAVVGVVA